MREIILVIYNVRSCHNVGAMLRTSEGLGVSIVILAGYTPYPRLENDDRLPHLADKITKQIAKTSLGAEKTLNIDRQPEIAPVLNQLKSSGFTVAALEQATNSIKLPDFTPPDKLAIVVGNEVSGLESDTLSLVDITLEIPMLGKKESFNVASSAAMALFRCRYS